MNEGESSDDEAVRELVVQFLGSGDTFGSGGRLQTCIHVRAPSTTFLIDCGASALVSLKRFGVDPSLVDSILLTHLHGDHFGGIPFFVLDAQFSKRDRSLAIAGPPGCEERVRGAMELLFPGSSRTQERFPIEFFELEDGSPTPVGSILVTPFTVIHESGAPSYALRVECEGKTIAYSGDTEWTDALLQVADGADLFICEAYFYEKRVKYHLDFTTLRSRLGELRCRRLVVTHMSKDMLDRIGTLDVEAAEDGKTLTI